MMHVADAVVMLGLEITSPADDATAIVYPAFNPIGAPYWSNSAKLSRARFA